MKLYATFRIVPACLAAAVLISAGQATFVNAATAPAPSGQIIARPLTHQEVKDYSLPADSQVSGGLLTVGVGQPAYLEVDVDIGIPATNIVNVVFELTSKPIGSAATLAPSPLGSNIPIYSPADRAVFQLAGRSLLLPDVTGQYTVRATVMTNGGSFVLSCNVSAANYLGAPTCALCHSGGAIADDKYHPWSQTGHASFFTRSIDGLESSHYNKNCIQCHTVGYDTNSLAVNGGFDDIAAQVGWTFPTNLTSGNWDAVPGALKYVANIQCENCHGPGSEHGYALGNTNLANWPRISVSYSSGDCAQCHDDQPYHVKNQEWNNSRHAIATRYPTGENRASCVPCHSGIGFIDTINGTTPLRTAYEAVTCSACHDPHNAQNPNQLRTLKDVTLMDKKTTITAGGKGKLCMECHLSRRDATNYVEVSNGSAQFGPHHGPQTDMLVGANAVTYGKDIPSSAHREVVTDSCVTCHLQQTSANSPAHLQAGGHTFRPGWDGGTPNDPSDDVHLTAACVDCHGAIDTFDLKRQDYDGDGVVKGVQTEVKGLLSQLGFLLPPVGVPKDAIAINSSWSRQHLRAGYNFQFVLEDGSYGVHNVSYAVGLLKASIADLTGDANQDGLADWWQLQYFGSLTNPDARPNATPAGDGVPNWLKFGLGLNPMTPGAVLPDGVVWANAGPVGNPGATNTIQIYTAAEVVFNTEVGKTYQLQAISSLGQGWKNVGAAVEGTGGAMSLVTPTRSNQQQFYQVVITP